MSVMFDPEAAIYPFPPKPVPLSLDEKQFYRENDPTNSMNPGIGKTTKHKNWKEQPEAAGHSPQPTDQTS